MSNKMSNVNNIYKLDGRVLVAKAIPFGLQHILAIMEGRSKTSNSNGS